MKKTGLSAGMVVFTVLLLVAGCKNKSLEQKEGNKTSEVQKNEVQKVQEVQEVQSEVKELEVESAPENEIENQEEEASEQIEETVIIEAEEIPENPETKMKGIVNGTFFDEKEGVINHFQTVIFTKNGRLSQRENQKNIDAVYDSYSFWEDKRNVLFYLEEGDELQISKLKIVYLDTDKNASYWIEVTCNGQTGWFLLDTKVRNKYLYDKTSLGTYAKSYWDLIYSTTYDSGRVEEYKIPRRSVNTEGYSLKDIELREEPDETMEVSQILPASSDEKINNFSIYYVTAESDDYEYGGRWFYVSAYLDKVIYRGWTDTIEDWYAKNKNGEYIASNLLFKTPSSEIASYFQ